MQNSDLLREAGGATRLSVRAESVREKRQGNGLRGIGAVLQLALRGHPAARGFRH